MKHATTFSDLANVMVPNLSPGVPSLISALSNDDVDVGEVSELLEMHPVISARLIGLANSAWSAPDRPINDLKSVCVRLGLSVVKSSAIAYALAAPFNPLKCQAFDAQRFWSCTLLAAETADCLAGRFQMDSSIARTGAMLRNLGLIWLVDAAPVESNDALNACAQEDGPGLSEALNQYVGLDHLQATRYLLTDWEVPAELLGACEEHPVCPLARVSALGSSVAAQVYLGVDAQFDEVERHSISVEDLEKAQRRVSKQLEKIAVVAQSIVA